MGWPSILAAQGLPKSCRGKNLMADNHDLLKSPLCEGHGEVRVREVLQLLRDQTLESKMEVGLSGNAEASEEPAELAAVAATAAEPRDSKKTSTAGIRSCPCGAGVQKSDASGHRP